MPEAIVTELPTVIAMPLICGDAQRVAVEVGVAGEHVEW